MTREETLQYIYDLGLVEGYLRKLIYKEDMDDYGDYLQELYLQICEVPAGKWDMLWAQGTKTDGAKAVRGYISGLIYRNVRSRNSRIFNKLKKHKLREVLTDFTATANEETEDIRDDYDG